tara:strand:+ start:7420 stop:8658 length:1239 start_codon:yes stop_codon:yes gene_type:complete
MYILKEVKIRVGHRFNLENSSSSLDFDNTHPVISYLIPNIIGIFNKRLDTLIHQRLVTQAPEHKDLMPETRGFLHWLNWLDEYGVNPFTSPAALAIHPTYGYKQYLLQKVKNTDNLSDSTANAYLGVIRRFYLWLGEIKELSSNDFVKPKMTFVKGRNVTSSDLTIRVAKKSNKSLNPLKNKEQETLRTLLNSESDRFQLQVRVMRDCGLRLDECLTLPSHLFNEDTLANTTGLLVKGLKIGPHVDVHTKYGKTRELFITITLYESVIDYLISDEYEERLRKFRTLYGDQVKNEPIFISRDGHPYTKNAFYESWYKFRTSIRESMGEGSFKHKPHDLRATFGTNWLSAALDAGHTPSEALASLKEIMGHKNETTTMKYITFHNLDSMSDDVASFMDTYADEARKEFEKRKAV